MHLLKKIRYLRQIINQKKCRFPKSVLLDPSVLVNEKTIFEGKNIVGGNSNFCNSFFGFGSFCGSNVDLHKAKIGKFCSIARNVHVIDATHPINFVSTSPLFFNTSNANLIPLNKKNVFDEFLTISGWSCIIGNDVWIGDGVLIKGGIKIGDGAVIGMGAVITKDVEPYTVVGGVPAIPIKKRFDDETIEKLISSKWWSLPENALTEASDYINEPNKFLDYLRKIKK